MSNPSPNEGEPSLVNSPGLLITGELVAAIARDPEQVARINAALGVFGLRGEVVVRSNFTDVQTLDHTGPAETREEEPAPFPVTAQEFRAFAEEQGYSKIRAGKAWWMTYLRAYNQPKDRLPQIKFVDQPTDEADQPIDLRNVHQRLVASHLDPEVWGNRSANLFFLAHLVNEKLHPDTPLPTTSAEHKKYLLSQRNDDSFDE